MGVRVDLPVFPIGEAALVDLVRERLPGWSYLGDWSTLDPEIEPLHMMGYLDGASERAAACFLSVNEVQPGTTVCRLAVGVGAADVAEKLLLVLAFLFPANREVLELLVDWIRERLQAMVWEEGDPMVGLSDRDRRLLYLWGEGYTAAEIGDDPGVARSPGSVHNVVVKLRRQFGVDIVPYHRN